MKKIICFNAPTGSGKDTGANLLKQELDGEIISIASPIKRLVSEIYRVPVPKLERYKNQPMPELLNCTPRECFIEFGETIKTLHGNNYWINFAIDHAQKSKKDVILIPDLGFRVELLNLVKTFGCENVLMVRLKREGCDFRNDSRCYVNNLLEINEVRGKKCFVECVHIENNKTLDIYREALMDNVSPFCAQYSM